MRAWLVLLCFVCGTTYAQDRANNEKKLIFQANLVGQLYQTAANLEFVKAQCKTLLPKSAPLFQINYEDDAATSIRRYIPQKVLADVLPQIKETARKRATFKELVIPGISTPEVWCHAAGYTHAALYTSLTALLVESAAL